MDFPNLTSGLPSGYVKIAIDNGHRNSEFSSFPIKNGDFQ